MIAQQLPDLPSMEWFWHDYTEQHPDGTRSRWITRWSNGSIEDRYYQPDGTWSRRVVRWPNGRVEDRHYHPDGTLAATIHHTT